MAKLTPPSLLLITLQALLIITTTVMATATQAARDADFIKSKCTATLYPSLCVQSLSSYASSVKQSDQRLAMAALSVSLDRARSARAYVSKQAKGSAGAKPYFQAVKDCVEHMGDSVDRLARSAKELGKMSGPGARADFQWHVSNVQTWVSAAITDDSTCADGLSAAPAAAAVEVRTRAAIKGVVTNVAKVTSNALALVNKFAEKGSGGVH